MLFDESLVQGLQTRPLRGQPPVGVALNRLLAGTGIGYRRTPDGAFVLYRLPVPPTLPAVQDTAISEILVIGRRTQNADIHRTENDIQPYRVATSREIEAAHRDNLDQFFRAYLTSNADVLAPAQAITTNPGATNSRVDLRGLGSQRTLVLIDGRRIPSLPSSFIDFDQGDLNGVPPGAIERIETLTGTAGGIYGPSAVGGVVNVILRRDYRGADLIATSGITDRGDAGRFRIEGRIGFTPDGGTTDIMLFGSIAHSNGLRFGQRDYDERSRRQAFANDPAGYLAPFGSRAQIPLSDAIIVTNIAGSPLTLDPEFGGTNLNASFTYLPLNFAGTDADRRAALVANAGKVLLTPPTGNSGARRSLLNDPAVIAGLFNIRRRFGSGIELFVDGLYFQNHGHRLGIFGTSIVTTAADAPNNPFAQRVYFRFPPPEQTDSGANSDLFRLVGGVIVDLTSQWRGSAEFALGWAHYRLTEYSSSISSPDYSAALATGLPAADGRPALAPLGDWSSFQAALASYLKPAQGEIPVANRFTDATLRLGGPIMHLPGGALSLNLLVERRREHIPEVSVDLIAQGISAQFSIQQRTQVMRSAYGELRAPLISMESSTFLLRGLELQLAARYDGLRARIPKDNNFLGETSDEIVSINRDAVVFTMGAKVLPIDALMLRGSFATGRVPPTLSQIQELRNVTGTSSLPDPRRGGRLVTSEGPVDTISGGSNDIGLESGSTLSIGIVLNPEGRNGPRLSIDYSRIATRGEILPLQLSSGALVLAEQSYPDRVIRAPLTDEDRALGFTGGRIILLDFRSGNSGRRIVKTVDMEFDWHIGEAFGGEISHYARATWLPSTRTRSAPDRPWIERVGYVDGALSWRANGGVTWARGPSAINLAMQYFHSYRVISSDSAAASTNARLVRFQGRATIPAQVYVDLAGRHRFNMAGRSLLKSIEVRLGILNLFDHSPPIIANPADIGYSAYGDPRRRRFEMAVASKF